MTGYVIVTMVLLANAGAIIIAPHSFGSAIMTRARVGLLIILSTIGLFFAVYNIKRMQIDQHRKWMLRTWFYMGSIITIRLIMLIAVRVISEIPGAAQYLTTHCPEIASMYGDANTTYHFYLACELYNIATLNPLNHAVVAANFNANNPAKNGAAFDVVFPMALWLALFMHVVRVELYSMLMPKGHECLWKVSWQRQMERGYRNPGSAGLVPEMVSDMDDWAPLIKSVAVPSSETSSGENRRRC